MSDEPIGAAASKALDEELQSSDASDLLASRRRGRMTPAQEAALEQARQLNMIVAAIAGMSWGKAMSPTMRRAFADYCRRYDVDPVTEMDNLGGNVYVNADWFLRKLGELRISGIIKDFYLEHIQADPRLDMLRKDQTIPEELRAAAQKRWFDNVMKRVEQNAPEEAEAICVCTIILPNGGSPVKGCKWAGNGTSVIQPKHNGSGMPNPVAENNPTLSVESQSIRRALRQLLSHITGARFALPNADGMDEDLGKLQDRVNEQAEAVAEATAAADAHEAERGPQLLTSGYDEVAEFDRQQRLRGQQRDERGRAIIIDSAEVSKPIDRPTLQRFADMIDPYQEPARVDLPGAGIAERQAQRNENEKLVNDLRTATLHPVGEPSLMRDPQVVAKVENVLRSATSADEVISGLNEIAASKVAEKIIEQIADGFRSQLDEQSDDEHRFVEQVLDVDVKNGETKTVAIDCPLILTPDDPPEKKRPLKACFACGNLVSGPHTAEHKLICVYYRSTPLPEVP